MIRILLWKFFFEWSQILRIISPCTDRKVYYFAFGANLSPEVLQRRRITVYKAYDFQLRDSVLEFSQLGFYKDQAYASANPREGEVVYGKMYLISVRDANRMDYYEGYPFLRVHEKVTDIDDGKSFFYYRSRDPITGLKPTREYLDYIVSAYREMASVPEAYVDRVAKTETLTEFLPQNHVGKYIRNPGIWPTWFRPVLVRYERCCQFAVAGYGIDRSFNG